MTRAASLPLSAKAASPEPTLRHWVSQLHRAMHQEISDRVARFGVTDAQYTAMFLLRRQPDLSNADLARWLGVTPQAANQIIQPLEAAGLVGRRASAANARILQTRLTAKGRRTIERCEAEAAEVEEQMQSLLDGAEREQLEALLKKCAVGMGVADAPADDAGV
jgi:DNA-binding MarR family transcriptional regulator